MPTKRTYGDGCGMAHAMDLVGERWALLVVRELLLGPKRFTDLRAGLPNASPNVLADRLRELEAAGVVRRRKLPPPASARVYELTEWGQELEDVVIKIGTWALRSPCFPYDADVGADSIVISLKARFDPEAARGFSGSYELRLGEQHFNVEIADSRIDIGRGGAPDPDAVIRTDSDTLAELIGNADSLPGAVRSGAVMIEGDEAAVTRLLDLYAGAGGVRPPAAASSST